LTNLLELDVLYLAVIMTFGHYCKRNREVVAASKLI